MTDVGGGVSYQHGTAVAFGRRGALVLGASGSGKSGLALSLLARGASLVADDVVTLTCIEKRVMMRPVSRGQGLIEARGIGILAGPYMAEVELCLCIHLDHAPESRLPHRKVWRHQDAEIPMIYAKGVDNLSETLYLLLNVNENWVIK